MISLFRLAYAPQPHQRPYLARIQTHADENAEVSVAVLTPAECKMIFGVPLANRGIQAVWVRVENRSESGTRVLMTRIARDYFTAREAAGVCHFSMLKRMLTFGFLFWFLIPVILLALPFKLFAVRRANQKMNDCFQELGFPLKTIAPGKKPRESSLRPWNLGQKSSTSHS